jgi:type I restriction enzyme S subunit
MTHPMPSDAKTKLTPKLRFPEFRDSLGWKEKFLREALSPVVREKQKPATHYTGLGLRSHGKGTFLKDNEDPKKNAMDYLYEVKRDDLIVNITFAWEGAIAIARPADEGALVSHRFPTYTFERAVAIPEFFQYIISTKKFVYDLGVISPGGAGRNRVLNKNDFLKLTTFLPEVDEQQKIAECLSALGELIGAESQKLDALKAHKKGLLQQLFPREGETLPRLRFPEFQNEPEWEEKKLGDIAVFFKGKGISKAEIDQNGKQPCIRYGELYTRYGEVIESVYSRTNIPASDLFLSRKNDVIIPASGETKEDIAKASCVMRDDVALGGDLNVIRTDRNGVFLSYYLNGPKKLDIAKVAQGHTVVHLYPSQLEKLEMVIPKGPEQQKIADCLSSLDELIAAQEPIIEALKTHKQGLIQQLFPSPLEAEA